MQQSLESFTGGACEVRSMENELLLRGRLDEVINEGATKSLILVGLKGEDLPVLRFGTRLKVAMRSKGGEVLIVGGAIYIANEQFWRLNNIVEYNNGERRAFFRVGTKSTAIVHPMGTQTEELDNAEVEAPARLVNVSLSGVLFATEAKYYESQRVYLSNFMLGSDPKPFEAKCIVRKIGGESAFGFLYGCSFEDMSARESDRLCKAIFELERESLSRRMGKK